MKIEDKIVSKIVKNGQKSALGANICTRFSDLHPAQTRINTGFAGILGAFLKILCLIYIKLILYKSFYIYAKMHPNK